MRVTMIVDDSLMSVDGKPFRTVEMPELAAGNVHAVQWYDNYGEVEYKGGFDHILKMPTRPPNEYLDSFADYQKYVDAYNIENAKQMLLEKEREDAAKTLAENAAKAMAEVQAKTLAAQATIPKLT